MIKFSLSVLMLLVSGFNVFANETSNEVAHLQTLVDSIKTYSADFAQTQPDESVFQENLSSGHFDLKRPGRLFWQYQTPDKQTITVDGKNLWVFDEDLDQVTVRGLSDVQKDFPMSWLLFKEPIAAKYTVIYGGISLGVEWFNLVPKENTYFQSLDVGIKKGLVTDINMYQSADNVTKIHLINIQKNQPISNQRFQFVSPEGADVIGVPQS